METHDFFLYLLIILLTARVFAELAMWLHVPSVMVITFTTLLSPFIMRWFYRHYDDRLQVEIHG